MGDHDSYSNSVQRSTPESSKSFKAFNRIAPFKTFNLNVPVVPPLRFVPIVPKKGRSKVQRFKRSTPDRKLSDVFHIAFRSSRSRRYFH